MKRNKLSPAMSSPSSRTRQSKTTNQSSSSAAAELITSGSEQDQHTPEPVNPLMNPVVLSVLFEVCCRKELKNYRLVCKMWHKESLPRWRKSMRLRVHDYDYNNQKCPKIMLLAEESNAQFDGLSMKMFIKAVDEREQRGEYEFTVEHFRALYLELSIMRINESISADGLPFWNSCGSWIHHLCLDGIADENYFSQLEIFLVEKLPNLKSLKLRVEQIGKRVTYGGWNFNNVDINEAEKEEQLPAAEVKEHNNLKMLEIDYSSVLSFPCFWVQFFGCFPNLQAITLRFKKRRRDPLKYDRLEKLLEAILEVRQKDKTKLCIKHFKLDDNGHDSDLDGKISNGVVNLFLKLNLPLQTLKLHVEGGTPADRLAKILCCHATTLRSLSLFRGQSDIAFPNFPFGIVLDNLTTLKLQGVFAPNLSFLRYTPNLEELYVSVGTGVISWSENGDRIFGLLEGKYDFISETKKYCEYCDMSSVKLLRFHKLELHFPIEDSRNMKSLTSWMPNVELFEGEINAGCFSVMCQNWKHSLRELRIHMGKGIDDQVITGIPPKLKKLSRKKSSLEVSELPGNITNLKNLQICEMKKPRWDFNENLCSHILHNITDISIREGFLKLPNLRELELTMSEEMSKTSRIELEQKQIKLDVTVLDSCSCGQYKPRIT